MPRSPYEVSAACYRKVADGIFAYAVFKRSDAGYWQLIAGGGEGQETPEEAVRREALEEAGIPPDRPYLPLDTRSSVPVDAFPEARKEWPEDLYVVPGFYFAVETGREEIQLSVEHTEYKWVSYIEAVKLLHWQSDVTALWELEQRLQRGDLQLKGFLGGLK